MGTGEGEAHSMAVMTPRRSGEVKMTALATFHRTVRSFSRSMSSETRRRCEALGVAARRASVIVTYFSRRSGKRLRVARYSSHPGSLMESPKRTRTRGHSESSTVITGGISATRRAARSRIPCAARGSLDGNPLGVAAPCRPPGEAWYLWPMAQTPPFVRTRLPFGPPLDVMLAKASKGLPAGEGWLFEPKWDGFRTLIFRDGDQLFLQSRDRKPLRRYFPELDAPLLAQLPDACVLDGELVVVRGSSLDFENPFAEGSAGERGIVQLHPRGVGSRVRFVRSEAYRRRCENQADACQGEVIDEGAAHVASAIARCGTVEAGLGAYNSGVCQVTSYSQRVLESRVELLQLAKADIRPERALLD